MELLIYYQNSMEQSLKFDNWLVISDLDSGSGNSDITIIIIISSFK